MSEIPGIRPPEEPKTKRLGPAEVDEQGFSKADLERQKRAKRGKEETTRAKIKPRFPGM